MSLPSRTLRLDRLDRNGCLRRYLVIAGRSGGGRLTERTPAVRPRPRERLFAPLSRHSRHHRGSSVSGERLPFVAPPVPPLVGEGVPHPNRPAWSTTH